MRFPVRVIAATLAAASALTALAACKSATPSAAATSGLTPVAQASPAATLTIKPTLTISPAPRLSVRPTIHVTTAAPHTSPSPTPRIVITVVPTIHPTLVRRPDFTIGLGPGHECTLQTDADNTVWLNPYIELYSTGSGAPAIVGYNMVTNWAKWTASGGLHPNVAQTWAIQIGTTASTPAFGHILLLTMTADPGNDVVETNEANNVTVVTVDLTGVSSPPAGAAEPHVPCS